MADVERVAFDLIFSDDLDKKHDLFSQILDEAQNKGVFPASINDLYMARGRGECSGFTVPAINLRCLTYDLARAIFRVAKKNNAGAFIFEIAKSEMGYTDQRPCEFTGVILAAAVREEYKGPVFIQGDHFQAKLANFKSDRNKELQVLKDLIQESISGGFFNIDIDSSTLVELDKPTLAEQQKNNFEVCAELTQFMRGIQPKGVVVSVGGEIGEVGSKNSTPEDLDAFMEGYLDKIKEHGMKDGISKISIQTGTSHGGVVLPDGTIAKVKLDFDTLKTISKLSRDKYGMSGAVQHGASTLPEDAFHKFPETEAAEVHLATQFQNMVYENAAFPVDLKQKMYDWLHKNCASEKKDGQTEDQFVYKTRKKALGAFKKDLMGLAQDVRDKISTDIEEKFDFLFKQLKVGGTKELVDKFIKQQKISLTKHETTATIDGEGDD